MIKNLFPLLLTALILNYSNTQEAINKNKDCDLNSFSIGECYQKCRIDYAGERNFFNRTDGICYKTLNCNSNEEYDIATNTCKIPLKDYINNLPTFNPENLSTNKPASENIEGKIKIPKINCVNGFIPSKSTICICYSGYTDSASIMKDSNNTTNIINKCDRVIEGFSNSTSKNPKTDNQNTNNTISTITNTNAKPGQNTFIPDFIVKNSSLYANGLIDTVASNNTITRGNQTSNISDFLQEGFEYQSTSVSPKNTHKKQTNSQNFPQYTNTDLNNNKDYQINFNNNCNGDFNSSEFGDNNEKDLNYKKFQKRPSNLKNKSTTNANDINNNYFFNPQNQRNYNFFEQDVKGRKTHRRNLSNDALLNNISSRDYSNLQHNYNIENENCNQTFTNYTYINDHSVVNNRNINNNRFNYDGNANAYDNPKFLRNNNDISCNNLITSEECYNNKFDNIIQKSIIQPGVYRDDFPIVPINNNHYHHSMKSHRALKSDVNRQVNKSNRCDNKNMNSHLKIEEPCNFISRENPEKRDLINPLVAKKLIFEGNQNFQINNCFKNINTTYVPYDSENVNCEYLSENTNNIDTTVDLQNNLKLAEFNKFKNQGRSYFYYRPSTLIFRKGKNSKSMDITNRSESYFLGEDISEEENEMTVDKGNNTFIQRFPNPYLDRSQIYQDQISTIRNRSNSKFFPKTNNNNNNFSNHKKKISKDNYFNEKQNNYPFNHLNEFDENPFKNIIKKRSKSTSMLNSTYSKKPNRSNSYRRMKNYSNLSNGIKSNNHHIDKKSEDDFYYNEDLDEFNSGIDIGTSVNGNNNYLPKINSIRHFDTSENNLLYNNTNQINSTANNCYFNNNFLNTNFHEETENYNNNNPNNFIDYHQVEELTYNNYFNESPHNINTENRVSFINNSDNSKIFNTNKKPRGSFNSHIQDLNGNKVRKNKSNFVSSLSNNKIMRRKERNSRSFCLDHNMCDDVNKNSYSDLSDRVRRKSKKAIYLEETEYKNNNFDKSNRCRNYKNQNGSGTYLRMRENEGDLKYTPETKKNFKFYTSIKKPIKRRLNYNDF